MHSSNCPYACVFQKNPPEESFIRLLAINLHHWMSEGERSRTGITFHKDYSDFVAYKTRVEADWGSYMTKYDTFIISLKSDQIKRPLTLKYLADYIKSVHSPWSFYACIFSFSSPWSSLKPFSPPSERPHYHHLGPELVALQPVSLSYQEPLLLLIERLHVVGLLLAPQHPSSSPVSRCPEMHVIWKPKHHYPTYRLVMWAFQFSPWGFSEACLNSKISLY